MRTNRSWLRWALVMVPLALLNCGDDDDDNNPGTAGKGGSSAGTAGTGAGTAGTSAGTAGVNAGGAGGAGKGGSAGTTGGSSGAGAGGATSGTLTKGTNVTSGSTVFTQVFDAVPSPDGASIYFTGVDTTGNGNVFKVPAAGGAISTLVSTGSPLVGPIGLAINGAGDTLFIADIGAAESATKDGGRVFVLSTNGGTPEALNGGNGLSVRGLHVTKAKAADATETLFFTALGSDGAGVYSLPVAGGTPSIVAAGDPFVDPSAVVAQTDGKIYVTDSVSPAGQGRIIVVEGTKGTVLVDNVALGYPAGIALSSNGAQLFVSGHDSKNAGSVLVFDTATKAAVGPLTLTNTAGLSEPGGLHRASNAATTAWVDGLAGGGVGAVFALTP